MPTLVHEFDTLLNRARECDNDAVGTLLTSQQAAMKRLVSARFDRRLAARLDVEDVIQDIWVVAVGRLPEYVKDPRMPFPDWLHHVALDCLSRCHRRHIRTRKRSVCAEARRDDEKPDGCDNRSQVTCNVSVDEAPSCCCERRDLCERIEELMMELSQSDQKLLRLRIVEQIPAKRVATTLGITEVDVSVRQIRALRWLRHRLLDDLPGDGTQ